jgi:hypothetical protein
LSGTETKPGDWDFTASLSESDLFAEALLRSVQLEGSDTGVERDLASGWLEPGRDCCDVNIEGVTQGPVTDASGETEIMRLFALREPLFCEAGKAVSRVYGVDIDGTALRRLIDLPAVIDDENVPGPHRLSDIAYDSNSKSYWLLTSVERSDEVDKDRVMAPCSIAGSASRGADKGGALWRWDGDPTHQPNLVSVTAFHKPEGIAVSADGRLVVVYDDDGDSPKCGGVPLAPYSIGENLPNHRLWQECGALLPACQGNN